MTHVNFLLTAICSFQSYIPLFRACHQLQVKPLMYIRKPLREYISTVNRMDQVKNVCKEYQVTLLPLDDLKKNPGITFVVEADIFGGSGTYFKKSYLHQLDLSKYIIISLPRYADFVTLYPRYIAMIDYALFPNSYYANYYKFTQNPQKNLGFGAPRYDFNDDSSSIFKKYNLSSSDKYVLFFIPKPERPIKVYKEYKQMIKSMFSLFTEKGFKIIMKYRYNPNLAKLKNSFSYAGGDQIYIGESPGFYPNSAMELLSISSYAVLFGSTAIEECTMMRVPFIEFVQDRLDRLSFLRHPSYGMTFHKKFSFDDLKKFLNPTPEEISERERQFDKTIKTCLFDRKKVSSTDILKRCLQLKKP